MRLVGGHQHRWREYVLKDEQGIYFKGYRCIDCKAAGYSVPARGPARAVTPSAGERAGTAP